MVLAAGLNRHCTASGTVASTEGWATRADGPGPRNRTERLRSVEPRESPASSPWGSMVPTGGLEPRELRLMGPRCALRSSAWLRGSDSNRRSPAYEAGEDSDSSTPRQHVVLRRGVEPRRARLGGAPPVPPGEAWRPAGESNAGLRASEARAQIRWAGRSGGPWENRTPSDPRFVASAPEIHRTGQAAGFLRNVDDARGPDRTGDLRHVGPTLCR